VTPSVSTTEILGVLTKNGIMAKNNSLSIQKKKNEPLNAASNQSSHKSGSAFLVDNRIPVAQTKSKNTSMGGEVIQAQSRVKTSGQNFTWGPHKTIVGHQMKAWLDPNKPLKGESASVNTNQTPMMKALRQHYVINGGDLVKGHLLNDNLGGKALNNNLFPITRAANKQHLLTTENYAKAQLWTHGTPIWYSVNVTGTPNANQPQHAFNVALGQWDMASNTEHPAAIQGSIVSNMGDPRDYDGANADDLDKQTAESLRIAVAHGRAIHPHKGSTGMDATEQKFRAHAGEITNTEHDNSGFTQGS